ncbi:rCG37227 [Rattus norvegicus]|uniref:RCG37227 n=1 Tax=Rattus norvegicus TaxID=10116 RepID=A6KI18_RAT|nr:rCG37227 [Rattus norvegicus]
MKTSKETLVCFSSQTIGTREPMKLEPFQESHSGIGKGWVQAENLSPRKISHSSDQLTRLPLKRGWSPDNDCEQDLTLTMTA